MTNAALTQDSFAKLVSQANLVLTSDEAETIKAQLNEAIKAVEVLSELDTKGVPTLNHPTGDLNNVMRDDVVAPSLPQSLALSGARKAHKGYFVVKAVFNESS